MLLEVLIGSSSITINSIFSSNVLYLSSYILQTNIDINSLKIFSSLVVPVALAEIKPLICLKMLFKFNVVFNSLFFICSLIE